MTDTHCPANTGRLFCSLTDAQGLTARYRVLPLPHMPGNLRAYRLVKLGPVGQELARYLCELTDQGETRCECRGFQGNRSCKHVRFLMAAGLFERDLLLKLKQLVEDLEARQRQLAAAIPTARQAALRKPRRTKKEAA
jgi:hypothetical protein